MDQVQKIAVKNNTGYVFKFSVKWQSSDGTWHITTKESDDYPTTQSRTLALDEIGVPADASAVTPYGHTVDPKLGHAQGTPCVTFAPNNRIARYEATVTREGVLIIVLEKNG
ncbi:conserved protein of unknown function (plasmid) [Cupriavidus taiwanensis]|uniref:Uncharacterized protein n=1 Tax=Cupriavidus taiwanensis TaxID=164546 RepID=A0A375HA30_9BURK|nr:hypothetical protein [Cupriavidus taiwanensis]SOZ70925.1 conserved protein of unknown function [Cupriavidus taiwanensis]SOZ72124.1 conserved protein of unknown function [Cupriavidus taiwanensis]SOZ74420.1 conserved protein of unknown function [Cupriavidus taiwanensis]SPA03324.1 conserved protein of unknown function [Cupriavidus taiwanensis]SPA11300.1 conserved protein of unknown function [Cupriavidus taiwanensis]